MKVGDLMVVCATRNASVTPPTLPADWTLIATKVGTTYSSILAYKYALNPTDISGTWTNATELVMHVYRGSAGKFACIGASASSNGTATPIAYPALTLLNASTSWVACFGGAKGASTTIESPPSGTTLRQDEIATGELASFDTNGVVASWAAHNVTVTGTVTNYIAWSLEIQDKAFTPFGLTQTAYNDVSPASTSSTTTAASFAAAVTSGGFVWGIYSGGNSFAITGVTDDKGNTYNVGSQPAGGGGQLFWLGNITNAPTTITVTVGTTDIFRSMVIQEWSGVFAASDPSDAATAQQHQAAPGTGTDAVTSGSITTVTNGDLILGTYQSDGGLACDIFGGTNFTKTFDNLSNGNTDFAVEARVQATAGAIAATFTQGGTPSANGTEAFVLAVKPAATSTAWAGSAALAPAAALTANASIRQAARASMSPSAGLVVTATQRDMATAGVNAPNPLFGVNMSGAEFSPLSGGPYWPTTADWAYVANKGVSFVRLPIAWEGIQPTLLSALDATYLSNLKSAISNAAAQGIGVIVDLHNFAQYTAQAQWTTTVGYAGNAGNAGTGVNVLGDTTLTSAAFVDLWTRLATALVGTSGLIGYDLMNEPSNNMTAVSKNLLFAPNGFGDGQGAQPWFPTNSAVLTKQAVGSNPLGSAFGPAWNMTNGTGFGSIEQSITFLNVPYTISCYAKVASGTYSNFELNINNSGGDNVVTTTWQRFTSTRTPTAGAGNITIQPNSSAGANVLIANAQLELGSSATAYVPNAWYPFAQAAITAIRALDATTPIYVGGLGNSTANLWQFENWDLVTLSGSGLVFQAHQYFDGATGVGGGGNYTDDYSSYSGLTSASGVAVVQPFLDWLSATGATGILGEFGVPNKTTDNNAAWLPLQLAVVNALKTAGVKGTQWFYGSNGAQPSNDLNIVPVAGVDDARLTQMLAVGTTPVLAATALLSADLFKLIGQQSLAPSVVLTAASSISHGSTSWSGALSAVIASAVAVTAKMLQAARASAALASSLTINEDQWYSAKTALAPAPALVSSTGQCQSAVAALAPSTALTGDATRSTIQSASVALAPSTALIASTAQRYAASTALAPSTGLSVNASQVSAFAPYRLVQSVFNDVSPATLSDTTIVCSFAAPVSIGGFVWGIADYASGPALTSVTDDQGNVYNTTVGPTGSNIFWLGHITNAPTTITINLAGASIFRSMAMQEWSGVAAVADPSDGSIAVDQTTPGTGSDAVTTGNITTTFNNDLILGGYISFSGGPEPGLLAGTGYIKTLDNQSTTNTPMALEARVQTTAAPIAATWTQSAAGEARSYMLAVESATQAWVASLAAAAGAVLINQTQMLQVARAAVSASAALSAKGNVGLAARTALLSTVALTTTGKVWGAVRTTLTPATGLTAVGSVEVAAASALAPSVGPNRENLLVDSEFGLAGWVLQHSTITANAGTAPNGTNTAAAFAEDTATSFHYAYQRVAKPLVAQTYTFSCYYKPLLVGTPHVFELDIADQGENIGVFADFDSSGNLVDSGTYGFTLVSAGSAVLDNGWIRAWITGTTNATGIVEVSINVAESGPGDGVSGSYVWGAQLELSSTPSAYIPAINTPSFDFNPQTVIFDSETLAASAGFVATATQAMSAPAALVPATGVVVSASQRQSISAFLSGATACTAVLSPLAAQQWLASALLGPASILGLSTAQMLVGTIAAFAPSAILATNPQVQSPGLVVLAPAAILAATEKMRLVAQAALAPATTASSHASILVAASKALSPVAALAAAQTIAMIAAAESMAALALLVPTARENQGGLAAFNPSNTMSTAEVQRLLAEAGMSGSADLGDAILPVFHGVHSTDNVAEADLASVESMRLKTSTAMPIQTIFAPQAAVQPSFFIHWLNEVVLASSSLQRQAASAALAGIGQTHAGLVQYRAAQSLLNFNIDLRAASTTAHGAFAALDSETTLIETFNKVQSVVSQIGITSNWKTQAGVIRNIKAHLTPALFTDLHIKVRRVRVASATLTGQRQTARIIGRRSNGGVIGQQSPGVIGQQSLDNIIAKGAFQVNLDE
jgi:hypothetical protein